MIASLRRRLVVVLLPATALALAACSDKAPFDPAALSENTDDILTTLDNSAAMQSMSGLGEKMSAGAPSLGAPSLMAATLPNVSLRAPGFPAWAQQRMYALQSALPALSVAAPDALIPTLALGKTFVYNPATGKYEVSTRTGAPSNGVRFILYAVVPITHAVADPLTEVGYVDLLDETAGTTAQLHIQAFITASGTTPLIDYTASATLLGPSTQPTGATVTASGHVSDGTTTVEFDLSQTVSTTSGISVNYHLTVPEKDIDVTFEATYTLTLQATVTLTVKHGNNTGIVTASGTQAAISGKITWNGDVVINIAGSAANPTFTDAGGNALTDAQVTALKRLFEFADRLLDHVDAMLGPARLLLVPAAFL